MAQRTRRPGPSLARIAPLLTALAALSVSTPAPAQNGGHPAVKPAVQADPPPENPKADKPGPPQETQAAPTLSELIDQLGDPDLGARENASAALERRAAELERAVEEENLARTLTPEQRARVSSIIRLRFFDAPRAGLGVSFEPSIDGSGVVINRVLPEFPVSEFLVVGDAIEIARGIDLTGEQSPRATTMLRYAILSLEPGETLDVVVRRNGERMEMSIPTGSYAQLGNPANLNARLLENAWRVRERRLGLIPQQIAAFPEPAEDWTTGFKPRIDVPDILPAGRPASEQAAASGMPALARNDRNALSKRDLVIAERLRLVEARVKQSSDLLIENMDALQELGPNDQRRDAVEAQVRSLRLQIQADQRLIRQLRTRLAESD